MMKLILVLWASILVIPAVAQSDPHNINLFQNFGDSRNLYIGLMPKSSGTKGTPFIFDEMPKGDLIMANGKIHEGVYINILPDKAEIFIRSDEAEDAKVIIMDNKRVGKIIFNTEERTFMPLVVEDKNQIAEIIYEGDQKKLIALHEKKFNKAEVGGAYNSGPKYDTYQHIVRYFMINPSGEEEIKNNKTGLKTLGKDNWKTLQQFVKDNNLDMGEPADLRKIYIHALDL
ncbi:hypothetical protein [Anditalea andensis]|uniref:DUF4369 domain-containing protein n=1 Tax=Anditalea andensis TaxID=1048983 RepID=A0A074L612_9BACT|nr:hypothetical protein [Anditalea andensis]KEO75278.1 hypothetical protein EL17_01690 [Anditalea andensis]